MTPERGDGVRHAVPSPGGRGARWHARRMFDSLVWILAAVTGWGVASLALALVVGPLLRERREGTDAIGPDAIVTEAIPIQHPVRIRVADAA